MNWPQLHPCKRPLKYGENDALPRTVQARIRHPCLFVGFDDFGFSFRRLGIGESGYQLANRVDAFAAQGSRW